MRVERRERWLHKRVQKKRERLIDIVPGNGCTEGHHDCPTDWADVTPACNGELMIGPEGIETVHWELCQVHG